jgi:hypothetical protein
MSDLLQFMVTEGWEAIQTESKAAQPMEIALNPAPIQILKGHYESSD